jgi:hypothetical protein
MKLKHLTVSMIIMLFLCLGSFLGCIEEDTVVYEVVFSATWSEDTHPDDFPSNPHFSGLIGASHNNNISFWSIGELATPGMKNMAETGSKNPLNQEISTAILNQDALDIISGDGISLSPGSVNVTFQVSENFPYVTLVTMIAPSPDWFVGVDSLNLFENGAFVEEKTIVLYPYDAGTDSGVSYTAPDNPTDPPIPVYLLDDYPFIYNDEIVPLGTFVFTRNG